MADAQTRVAVLGATGQMGRLVLDLVRADSTLALVAALSRRPHDGIGAVAPGCFDSADVVIDFSLPEALRAAVPCLGSTALVSGTTGLNHADLALLDAQSTRGPVLHAANFSLGVHVLVELVRRAAGALPHADIEIVETHHRRKVDSPSGTALVLGDAAAAGRGQTRQELARHGREGSVGPRPPGEIGFHAVRGGDVVGEHVVQLLADGERLALTHQATSRATFAHGAVRAASWISGRPAGRYTLSDVLGP